MARVCSCVGLLITSCLLLLLATKLELAAVQRPRAMLYEHLGASYRFTRLAAFQMRVATVRAPLTPMQFQKRLSPEGKGSIQQWIATYKQSIKEAPNNNSSSLTDPSAARRLMHSCEINAYCHPPGHRSVLIIPAGDDFNASQWIPEDVPYPSPYDVIVLHYGNGSVECPGCTAILEAGNGTKWKLVHDFAMSKLWEDLLQQHHYEYIMVPDDDLQLSPCALSRVFTAMRAYNLTMAQPSLCNDPGVFSHYSFLYQNSTGSILRFCNFIEVMAPTFESSFFQSVIRPSLQLSFYGTGMDSVWPTLLGNPTSSIAVIDAACMKHYPKDSNATTSLYRIPSPWGTNRDEEAAVFKAFNVTRRLGWVEPHVHGVIKQSDVLKELHHYYKDSEGWEAESRAWCRSQAEEGNRGDAASMRALGETVIIATKQQHSDNVDMKAAGVQTPVSNHTSFFSLFIISCPSPCAVMMFTEGALFISMAFVGWHITTLLTGSSSTGADGGNVRNDLIKAYKPNYSV